MFIPSYFVELLVHLRGPVFPIFRHFKGGASGQLDKFTVKAVTSGLDLVFVPASNFAAENGWASSQRNQSGLYESIVMPLTVDFVL